MLFFINGLDFCLKGNWILRLKDLLFFVFLLLVCIILGLVFVIIIKFCLVMWWVNCIVILYFGVFGDICVELNMVILWIWW